MILLLWYRIGTEDTRHDFWNFTYNLTVISGFPVCISLRESGRNMNKTVDGSGRMRYNEHNCFTGASCEREAAWTAGRKTGQG